MGGVQRDTWGFQSYLGTRILQKHQGGSFLTKRKCTEILHGAPVISMHLFFFFHRNFEGTCFFFKGVIYRCTWGAQS